MGVQTDLRAGTEKRQCRSCCSNEYDFSITFNILSGNTIVLYNDDGSVHSSYVGRDD